MAMRAMLVSGVGISLPRVWDGGRQRVQWDAAAHQGWGREQHFKRAVGRAVKHRGQVREIGRCVCVYFFKAQKESHREASNDILDDDDRVVHPQSQSSFLSNQLL